MCNIWLLPVIFIRQVSITPLVKKKLDNYYQVDKTTGRSVPHCINDTTFLKYFPSYRYPNCFVSCSIDATVKICGCVPYYYVPMAKKYSLRVIWNFSRNYFFSHYVIYSLQLHNMFSSIYLACPDSFANGRISGVFTTTWSTYASSRTSKRITLRATVRIHAGIYFTRYKLPRSC